MIFSKNQKMVDVIHADFHLLKITDRFGIKLGFGDKTVLSVCSEYGINPDFFVEMLNVFHDKNYFPRENLKSFSANTIIDYLETTHRYYLKDKLPDIESLIEILVDKCSAENKGHYKLILKFFHDYRGEMKDHIRREDEVVFPYAIEVENAYNSGNVSDTLLKRMKEYSIEDYYKEHEDIEEKLFDLKNIIMKYLPEPENSRLCYDVLNELFMLEKDMNDHSRMEDTVMVPKIIEMERAISGNKS